MCAIQSSVYERLIPFACCHLPVLKSISLKFLPPTYSYLLILKEVIFVFSFLFIELQADIPSDVIFRGILLTKLERRKGEGKAKNCAETSRSMLICTHGMVGSFIIKICRKHTIYNGTGTCTAMKLTPSSHFLGRRFC